MIIQVVEDVKVSKSRQGDGYIHLRVRSTRMEDELPPPSSYGASTRVQPEEVVHTFALHPLKAAHLAREILKKAR